MDFTPVVGRQCRQADIWTGMRQARPGAFDFIRIDLEATVLTHIGHATGQTKRPPSSM